MESERGATSWSPGFRSTWVLGRCDVHEPIIRSLTWIVARATIQRAAPRPRRSQHRTESPCPPSPSTTSPSCRGSPTRTRSRPASARCAPSRPRRAGFEGEGFPVRRAFRGRRPRRPRPVRPHGPDGRGGVRPGRAEGHALASAPGLRDRDLHDGRHLRAQRLERRRRGHHQRRHAVDDGRRRDPPHREAPGGAGRQRRAVPRHPALGEPAARPEVVGAALPGPAGATRSRWSRPPTAGRWCGSSPARSPGTPARARPTRP